MITWKNYKTVADTFSNTSVISTHEQGLSSKYIICIFVCTNQYKYFIIFPDSTTQASLTAMKVPQTGALGLQLSSNELLHGTGSAKLCWSTAQPSGCAGWLWPDLTNTSVSFTATRAKPRILIKLSYLISTDLQTVRSLVSKALSEVVGFKGICTKEWLVLLWQVYCTCHVCIYSYRHD